MRVVPRFDAAERAYIEANRLEGNDPKVIRMMMFLDQQILGRPWFAVPTGRFELAEARFVGDPMHEVLRRPHQKLDVGAPCYACVVERWMHDPGDEDQAR